MKTLFVDNYDSFTFNLVQALAKMGTAVQVRRNDDLSLAEVEKMCPDRIVISPGPKKPEDAGIWSTTSEWYLAPWKGLGTSS